MRLHPMICAAVMYVGLSGLGVSGTATAQSVKPDPVREAYRAAITCFHVNAIASDDRAKAGDASGADAYSARAKRSFDGAMKLGRSLGMTNRDMNHDLDVAEAVELPRLLRDRDYYQAAAANCKALGLM